MSAFAVLQAHAERPSTSASNSSLVQRKSACGGSSNYTGECAECEGEIPPGKPLRRELEINKPGDEYEREADSVAEAVMRMPDSVRTQGVTGSYSASRVQRRVGAVSSAGIGSAPPIVDEVLSYRGQPLDTATRAFFEPRFGEDFSHVRIHEDAKAAASARSINAEAYTAGSHVVFGANSPQRSGNNALLAHELAHVLQQGGGILPTRVQRSERPMTSKSCFLNNGQSPPGGWDALCASAMRLRDDYSGSSRTETRTFRNKAAALYTVTHTKDRIQQGLPRVSDVVAYHSGRGGANHLADELRRSFQFKPPRNVRFGELHNEAAMIDIGTVLTSEMFGDHISLVENEGEGHRLELAGYVFTLYAPCQDDEHRKSCKTKVNEENANSRRLLDKSWHVPRQFYVDSACVDSESGRGFLCGESPVDLPDGYVSRDNPNCRPAKRLKLALREGPEQNGWTNYWVTPDPCSQKDDTDTEQDAKASSGLADPQLVEGHELLTPWLTTIQTGAVPVGSNYAVAVSFQILRANELAESGEVPYSQTGQRALAVAEAGVEAYLLAQLARAGAPLIARAGVLGSAVIARRAGREGAKRVVKEGGERVVREGTERVGKSRAPREVERILAPAVAAMPEEPGAATDLYNMVGWAGTLLFPILSAGMEANLSFTSPGQTQAGGVPLPFVDPHTPKSLGDYTWDRLSAILPSSLLGRRERVPSATRCSSGTPPCWQFLTVATEAASLR